MKHNRKKVLKFMVAWILSIGLVSAQNLTIRGIVTDINTEPLVGVTVRLVDANRGTITDMNGIYLINNVPANAKLEFSYIGMQTHIVDVGGKNSINVVLKEDVHLLNEVVAIGYGGISARELTSSVSHISNTDFSSINSTNPLMQIQGRVASVSIQNRDAADPNSSGNVQIRGISSRNAGLGPLYVVDGISDVNIQNVNANDIQSIDILKDGAASAIYGTRGSNGVIIITTKKGARDGELHAIYNGFTSIDKIINVPRMLTADEFRKYRMEDGLSVDFEGDSDWFRGVTQSAHTQNHTLTLTGGTTKSNYRATLNIRDATGVDIRSKRKEYGARVSLNHGDTHDLLRFSLNIAPRMVNRDLSDQSVIDMTLRFNPTFPIKDQDDPTLFNDHNGKLPMGPNPVETFTLVKDGSETKYFDWNATAYLNILNLLDRQQDTSDILTAQITLSQNITDNFDFTFNPSTTTINRFQGIKGMASRTYSKGVDEALEMLINGSFNNKDHSFRGMTGYSYNYHVYSDLSARNRNFLSDALEYNNLGGGDNEALLDGTRVGMSSFKEDSKLIAFFGRLNYDYKKRYLLTASLRYEGSSRFGINNKWGFFPGVSVGWRISDESFLNDASWINDLKLRADFGVTGNQNIPNYRSLALYSAFEYQFYNGAYVPTAGPSSNVNPNLRWEKGYNWNIGVDFLLFNNIISGSLNYYNRRQKDLVGNYDASVPPNLVSMIYANVGTMKNSGLELELKADVIRSKDFSYNISYVGETMENEFVSFSDDVYQGRSYQDVANIEFGSFGIGTAPVQRLEEGRRVGSFYLYKYAGFDEKGDWLYWNADNTEKLKDEELSEEDRRYIGNGLPKYRVSLTNNFKYKNFDLMLLFRSAFKFDIYNTHELAYGLKNANRGFNTLLHAYTSNAHINGQTKRASDFALERGDFIKLDVATLGYNFKLKENRLLSDMRIYFTGRNLFTFKTHNGMDPDYYPVNGLTPGVALTTNFYPSTIQLLLGAQINF